MRPHKPEIWQGRENNTNVELTLEITSKSQGHMGQCTTGVYQHLACNNEINKVMPEPTRNHCKRHYLQDDCWNQTRLSDLRMAHVNHGFACEKTQLHSDETLQHLFRTILLLIMVASGKWTTPKARREKSQINQSHSTSDRVFDLMKPWRVGYCVSIFMLLSTQSQMCPNKSSYMKSTIVDLV